MRVLVIRLGAFGDFVQSFGPFAAIRRHHPDDHITLLTTAPYARLAADAPWFDAIETDARPAWWNIPGVVRLKRQLRLRALLEVWLYVHIPATVALLAALTAHVVSEFYYW